MGAPTIASGLNTFQPLCFTKVPEGMLVGVNGLDRGFIWDGLTENVWILGIDAPGTAPAVATSPGGNATAGQYLCYYRYLDKYGNPSNLSPAATVTAADGDEFTFTNFQASPNERIAQMEVWRTLSDEADTLYLVTTLDLTTASYVDALSDDALISKADFDPYDSLAFLLGGRPNANRFTPPPDWKAVATWFQDRMFYFADVVYDQGTVSVTNGSPTVLGSGVSWSSAMAGRYLYVNGAKTGYLIGSVDASPLSIIQTAEGGADANCVQVITIGGIPAGTSTPFPAGTPTGGTFTLTFMAQTTSAISVGASAATVQSALEALSTIGSGNCTVSGTSPTYTVTFTGDLAGATQDAITGDGSSATGGTISVTHNQTGSAVANEVQNIGFKPNVLGFLPYSFGTTGLIIGGEFTITFNNRTTPPIPALGTSAADLQTILEQLPSIGTGNVAVTKTTDTSATQLWQVTFQGNLAGIDLPQMKVNVNKDAVSGGVLVSPKPCIPVNSTATQGSPGGSNDTQTIALPYGVTGGTFTITFDGSTTGAINHNAPAATVQSALNSLASITPNTVTVTGGAGGPWTVAFDNGTLAGASQPLITCTGTSLTGTNISVSVTGAGGAGDNETQTLTVATATGGTFTLTFGGFTTTALAYNADAATIQAALEALSSIGSGNVTVSGGPGTFTIAFAGTLAATPQDLITGDGSSMTGVTNLSQITLDVDYDDTTGSGFDYGIRPEPKERNRVYYSEANEPESVPDVNEFTIQHDQNVDDELVGGITFMGGMYLLKQNHLYRLYYVRQPQVDIAVHPVVYRGAFNNRSIAIAESAMYLMDEWGPYAFDGSTVQKIGEAIQDYWRDGTLDFTQSKWFYVTASPEEQTVRFHVAFSGDVRCQHAFAFNYRMGTWHLEEYVGTIGHACHLPLSGRDRLLYGTDSDVIYLANEGTLDGTLGTGTVSGTATSAAADDTFSDSTATFPADSVGASIGILAGAAKGQVRRIVSVSGTTLTLDSAWTTAVAVGDSYQIGAVRFQYRTPNLRYVNDEDSNRREMRLAYSPTFHSDTLDLRRYFDHDASPATAPTSQSDVGMGVSWEQGSADQVIDISSARSPLGNAVGFVNVVDDGWIEDRTQSHRWVSYELRGFQALDQIKLLGLEFYGLESG